MKTAFVLGAAANFGLDNTGQFPIGSQLAVRIQIQIAAELSEQTMFPQGHIGGALSCLSGGLTNRHVEAMDRIENSIVFKNSIDDLVNEWSEWIELSEVAKICIATEILKSESTTQICASLQSIVRPSSALRQLRESWIGRLLMYANPNSRRRDVQDCLSGLNFVTFNYDRCLEASILMFLRYGQNVPLAECRAIMETIQVHHAYGSLGILPELGGNSRFGGFENREINWAATGIKTYNEELDSGHTEKIRGLVQDCENVVFLGFGFHEQNLKLLFGEEPDLGGRRFFGTCINMDESELARVRYFWQVGNGTIDLINSDCHSLVDALRTKIF